MVTVAELLEVGQCRDVDDVHQLGLLVLTSFQGVSQGVLHALYHRVHVAPSTGWDKRLVYFSTGNSDVSKTITT